MSEYVANFFWHYLMKDRLPRKDETYDEMKIAFDTRFGRSIARLRRSARSVRVKATLNQHSATQSID